MTNLCWWKHERRPRNAKSSVLQRKHIYGLTLRLTQPLMTPMLNNECRGKFTHQRPPVIISPEVGKDCWKHWLHSNLGSHERLCVTVNCVVTAGVNVHSRWLRGSSRQRWCSASWSSPRGQRWGWARTQWAASLSRWWISSSASWRSLKDNRSSLEDSLHPKHWKKMEAPEWTGVYLPPSHCQTTVKMLHTGLFHDFFFQGILSFLPRRDFLNTCENHSEAKLKIQTLWFAPNLRRPMLKR